MTFLYRVQVQPGQLDHLPAAVGPETGWLEAPSLCKAKRAVQGVVHALAQSLGRTTDTHGAWHVVRTTIGTSHSFVLCVNGDVPLAIKGEVIQKPKPTPPRR